MENEILVANMAVTTLDLTDTASVLFQSFLTRKELSDDLDVIVAGIPFDTLTTARPGTRLGPTGIRAAYLGNTCSPDLKCSHHQCIECH